MKLTVSLGQMRVATSAPEENLAKAQRLVAEAAARGSDLVCLPEMWTTGFDFAWNAAHGALHEEAIARVSDMARRHRVWINGSMPEMTADGRPANTSILFDAEGRRAATYRKTHLFSLFHEDRFVAPGQNLTVAQTPWGPVGLSVCYDIRFPEIFRTYALKGARMVLSPMAFPYPRLAHWKILVRARAIENQLFMVGTNQVGSEGPGGEGEAGEGRVTYFGSSVVVDPWGETVVEAGEAEEVLLTAELDLERADEVRQRMRVFQDRRPELYDLN